MSEARKCDRCHGYFELSEEDQKNRDLPYDMKGTYLKIMLFGRYGEVENSVRWFDLCPNCMELLDKWLENPDNDEEYQKALEGIKTYAKYKDPCKSCHNGVCEQCDYGYISEEEKKKRWLGNHRKKNVGNDDERVNNLYKEAEEIPNNASDTKEEEK